MIVEIKPSVKINDIAHRTEQTDENKEIFGDREERLQLMREWKWLNCNSTRCILWPCFFYGLGVCGTCVDLVLVGKSSLLYFCYNLFRSLLWMSWKIIYISLLYKCNCFWQYKTFFRPFWTASRNKKGLELQVFIFSYAPGWLSQTSCYQTKAEASSCRG